MAVVAGLDGFWGVGKGGQGEAMVEDTEKDNEDGYADCGLSRYI